MAVDITKIEQILSNLEVNKTQGYDGIENIVLKKLATSLSKSLLLIFRPIKLNQGTCSEIWKPGEITPVFKERDISSIDYYGPVSLLCSTSKVFEKLIFDTIYS